MRPILLAAALFASLAPLASAAQSKCAPSDKACLFSELKAHPVRTQAFWKAALARPVNERFGPAPADLVAFLRLDNLANGFPEKPVASTLAPDFVADLKGAIDDLPAPVKRLLDSSFGGVWFVDDLGGTGYTDLYYAGGKEPVGAYVVLDAKVLARHKANGWATWKENTPFKPATGWSLEARLEPETSDDRRGAIRYILLHELGHVLAARGGIHPLWDRPLKDVPEKASFPFQELSWRIERKAGRYVSLTAALFPERENVVYYVGPKLDGKQMATVYSNLAKTDYPTLYAATSPGDDFAESFASFVHVTMLGKPWSITVRKDGQVAASMKSCWDEPRCAPKRALLERLLR